VRGWPLLAVITALPFLGAVVIMAAGRTRPALVRGAAAAASTLALVLSVYVYVAYDARAGGYQFQERYPLVPPLGIAVELGVDGISVLMVLLTAIIIFAGTFASWTVSERDQEFYALLLTLTSGVFGVFVALDLFVFFLFYELAVLPMYLLIGIWGSSGHVRPQGIFGWALGETGVGTKEYAAMKLTLYLLLGSAFILVGIFVLYFASGTGSFSLLRLEQVTFSPGVQRWVFLALYVGFGILAGIWPLHTWSPDGHASAPTAVSMLHAGVLMKLGAYGVVRVAMGLLPEGTVTWAPLVGTIATINVVYGALSAMAQSDLKYVIAYSSVSHMGLVMLGAATLTEPGLNGSVFQMFAHGVMTGLFFALVGLIYEKSHTREIGRMGGFGRPMPMVAAAFTLGGLSSLGLPGTSGFVAEILTFLGAWQSAHPWWLFPAVAGTLFTAVYVLRVAKRIFWGPYGPAADAHGAGGPGGAGAGDHALPDALGPERVSLVFLSVVILLFGFVPALALSKVGPATVALLDRLGVLR
jgi:NADH-quinone oxidoreductase subunit M